MRTHLIALLLFCLPALALAQTYPALHDVTGVAADDTLNIRSGPGASAEKIGELAHDARDIEIMPRRGRLGSPQQRASAPAGCRCAYLARQEEGDYALNRELSCFGTEPFWSLRILQGSEARFYHPDGSIGYTAGLLQVSLNRTDGFPWCVPAAGHDPPGKLFRRHVRPRIWPCHRPVDGHGKQHGVLFRLLRAGRVLT